MTKTQQELTAYLESDNPESRSAAGIALLGVGYERGASLSTGETQERRDRFGCSAMWEIECLLDQHERGVAYGAQRALNGHSALYGAATGGGPFALLAHSLARFCAAGALLFALALPAGAAKVPCPSGTPVGSTCYLVVKAPGQQCKGVRKDGTRCTRTVGVSKSTGLCAQHKGQQVAK